MMVMVVVVVRGYGDGILMVLAQDFGEMGHFGRLLMDFLIFGFQNLYTGN
jgi:hypothetical protein